MREIERPGALRRPHSTNGWGAMLYDERDCREPYRSNRYKIDLGPRAPAPGVCSGNAPTRLHAG